jgi:ubiquinone/menaquinone biosynthesis C-methylase UbiE
MAIFKERLSQYHGGRILDVATGHGQFLRMMTGAFTDYIDAIGIDLSEENIKIAKEENGEKFTLRVMDGARIDFPDHSFDTVAISNSLHHLADISVTLDEMYRVLKPGGLFLVAEVFQDPKTERSNSQRHIHHWWAEADRYQGKSHNPTFTVPEIRELVKPLNLTVLESFESKEKYESGKEHEVLDFMLNRTSGIVKELITSGGPSDLIQRGEGLVELFRARGLVNESVLYILGRK